MSKFKVNERQSEGVITKATGTLAFKLFSRESVLRVVEKRPRVGWQLRSVCALNYVFLPLDEATVKYVNNRKSPVKVRIKPQVTSYRPSSSLSAGRYFFGPLRAKQSRAFFSHLFQLLNVRLD